MKDKFGRLGVAVVMLVLLIACSGSSTGGGGGDEGGGGGTTGGGTALTAENSELTSSVISSATASIVSAALTNIGIPAAAISKSASAEKTAIASGTLQGPGGGVGTYTVDGSIDTSTDPITLVFTATITMDEYAQTVDLSNQSYDVSLAGGINISFSGSVHQDGTDLTLTASVSWSGLLVTVAGTPYHGVNGSYSVTVSGSLCNMTVSGSGTIGANEVTAEARSVSLCGGSGGQGISDAIARIIAKGISNAVFKAYVNASYAVDSELNGVGTVTNKSGTITDTGGNSCSYEFIGAFTGEMPDAHTYLYTTSGQSGTLTCTSFRSSLTVNGASYTTTLNGVFTLSSAGGTYTINRMPFPIEEVIDWSGGITLSDLSFTINTSEYVNTEFTGVSGSYTISAETPAGEHNKVSVTDSGTIGTESTSGSTYEITFQN